MIEKNLLALMSDKDNHTRYAPIVRKEHVTQDTWKILQGMSEWHKKNSYFDWEDFCEFFLITQASGASEDQKEMYEAVLVPGCVLTTSADAILSTLNERLYFQVIAVMAQDIAEGKGGYAPEEVRKSLEAYEKTVGVVAKGYTAADILSMFKLSTASGLSWGLPELNRSIGDITKGNLLLVAGRPESGKTTFLVSQAVHFLDQLAASGRPLIYITNEDSVASLYRRFYQSGFCVPGTNFDIDPDSAIKNFETTYPGLMLFDDTDVSGLKNFDALIQVVKTENPGLVIIDQLRNVPGFKDEGSEIHRLKALYAGCRRISRDTCPFLVSHQLDGTAHGVMYPTENQLEGTKTEVQGALDVQIMMGRSYDAGYEDKRGLNIVKNKLPGGTHADTERHAKYEVTLDEIHQRFTGSY